MKIPAKGVSRDAVLAAVKDFQRDDIDWRSGRVWGYVYDGGEEVEALAHEVYNQFLPINALDFTVFQSVLRMENEIVAMAAAHLNGDENVAGHFTTGGTESCLLTVKTARDHAKAVKGIEHPEMVLPVTAHAAFHKGSKYFGVKAVQTAVDLTTYRADVQAIRDAITDNTALIVISAPSYAHGVVDPVREVAEIALEHDIPLHVDGCIGGFLLPYYKRIGAPVPDFDFSVPGVTSMSMDLHKYAFCSKGASVLLHRTKDYRQHQYFAHAAWPGYTIVNTTMLSTKTAGPLAAAWAVLNFIGDEGYLARAKTMYEGTQKIIKHIEALPDLRVLGDPEMSLVAFTSDTINVFRLADAMAPRGWYIQPQLSFDGGPANIHLSVTPASCPLIDEMFADMTECIEEVRGVETSEMAKAIPSMFASIDPASIDAEVLGQMTQMAGISSEEVPDGMAEINEILDALPDAVNEKLLIAYVNDLFKQPK